MTEAQQFFYNNASWSYDPRTQTPEEGRLENAAKMEIAEFSARLAGIHFTWSLDQCCCEEKDHDSYLCQAWSGDKMVASLGMICGPAREYQRVIEAELAMEWLNQPGPAWVLDQQPKPQTEDCDRVSRDGWGDFNGVDAPIWMDEKQGKLFCSLLNAYIPEEFGRRGFRYHLLNHYSSGRLYFHLIGA